MNEQSRTFTADGKGTRFNSAAQQLESADNLQELWEGLLPNITAPDRCQFLRWADLCSERVAAYAINRAARKALRQQTTDPLDTDRLSRYVTGIIVNERENRHTFSRTATQETPIGATQQ